MVFASSNDEILPPLYRPYEELSYSVNDHINIGVIGVGIQGIFDARDALTVSGTKVTAACDLYTGRLDRAKELWVKQYLQLEITENF